MFRHDGGGDYKYFFFYYIMMDYGFIKKALMDRIERAI